jgi:hypothetical protein
MVEAGTTRPGGLGDRLVFDHDFSASVCETARAAPEKLGARGTTQLKNRHTPEPRSAAALKAKRLIWLKTGRKIRL